MDSYPPQQQRRSFRRPTPAAARPQPPAPKPAVQISGRKDLWTTIQLIRDPGTNTTKTTRVCQIPSGVLINTCTRGPTGMCEALQYIPGATATDFKGGAA